MGSYYDPDAYMGNGLDDPPAEFVRMWELEQATIASLTPAAFAENLTEFWTLHGDIGLQTIAITSTLPHPGDPPQPDGQRAGLPAQAGHPGRDPGPVLHHARLRPRVSAIHALGPVGHLAPTGPLLFMDVGRSRDREALLPSERPGRLPAPQGELLGAQAGHLVAGCHLRELGYLDRAAILGVGAARVEGAAAGRIRGARHVALEDDSLLRIVGIRGRQGRQEGLGIGMLRAQENLTAMRSLI